MKDARPDWDRLVELLESLPVAEARAEWRDVHSYNGAVHVRALMDVSNSGTLQVDLWQGQHSGEWMSTAFVKRGGWFRSRGATPEDAIRGLALADTITARLVAGLRLT